MNLYETSRVRPKDVGLSKQTTQSGFTGFSYDSEELPDIQVPHGRQNKAINKGRAESVATTGASAALATIFQKQKEDKERSAQSDKLRQQFEQLQAKNTDHSGDGVHELNLDDLFVKKSTICDCHKGEPILNLRSRCCLFSAQKLDLKGYLPTVNKVDYLLRDSTANDLLAFIETGGLKVNFGRATNKAEVVRYVFRLLNVHTDSRTIQACRELLSEAFCNYPDTVNCINLQEFIKSILNFGADFDRLFPDPHLQSFVDSVFDMPKDLSDYSSKVIPRTIDHQLVRNLLNILRSVLQKSHTWCDKALTVLLVMLCALALDVHFTTSPIVDDIQRCISDIIALFDEAQWLHTVSTLSRQICALSNDHHNLVFLVNMFPNSSKQTELLKKVTSFYAIHKILRKELPAAQEELTDVSPKDVVCFLNGCTLRQGVDLYLWFNVLNLVNWCVSDNRRCISAKSLEELCDALKRLIVTLKDDARCIDDKKIKDVAMRIEVKWSMMKNTTPYSQKTMFGYLMPTNPSKEVQSSESIEMSDEPHEPTEDLPLPAHLLDTKECESSAISL